ncbi:MAG: MFS transporter [Desulfobacteraceae bacterium]|nr:MAG: MFS transporter [Desulfobacteraceae bacterium]
MNPQSSLNHDRTFFYGYVIIAACFLIQSIGVGTYIAFGVFFKPLLSEFGWSRATVSGASSLAYFLMGVLGVFSGFVNDRFGPRALMGVTALFYCAGYVLLSQVNAVWQLYLFFGVVLAIGLSPIDVIPMTLTARWFVRRRGMMTGIVKVGTGAGQMTIPLISGLLILHYGWRQAGVIIGLGALVILGGTGLFLRRDPAQMGQMPDGGSAPAGGAPARKEHGLTLREASRTTPFWLFCIMNFLVFNCLLTTMLHIVPHGSDMGLDPIRAAGLLSTIGGMSMAGRLLTGYAVDRIGNRKSLTICLVLLISGFLWLQAAGSAWMLYLFAAVYGIAHGSYFTVMSPLVAELFGIASHGAILGIGFLFGNFGGSLGPVLAGLVFDNLHSYRPVFLAMIALAAATLILANILKPAVHKGVS